MMIGLLVAGIVAILAGLLAIAYGFVLDLSFGNTLILAGAFGVCSGIIVLAQTLVVHELRKLGRKLGSPAELRLRSGAEPADDGLATPREPASVAEPGAASAPPWREEAGPRNRGRQEPELAPPPEVVEPTPAPPRRRNLLFSSNVRKERPGGSPDAESAPADQAPTAPEGPEASGPSFEDAWRRPEPLRPSEMMAQRRAARAAEAKPGAAERPAAAPPPVPRNEEAPAASAVTVIKSGVVDGMAYSLYSDGSIEAQMPEGMMHFASIDALRAHLDQRP
jgi:hypothetical protein